MGKVDPMTGILGGSFAFVQFASETDAKTAAKQAIIKEIKIDNLKINITRVQSNAMINAQKNLEKESNQIPSYYLQNISEQAKWSRRNTVSKLFSQKHNIYYIIFLFFHYYLKYNLFQPNI